MRFIRVWSYSCAKKLTDKLNENHQKRGIYYYGFQVVIGGIVKAIVFVAATTALGMFYETMAVMLFFGCLRVIAGGYHMDTYNKCLVVSLALFILAGTIVKYTYMYWEAYILIALMAVLLVGGLWMLYRWAPQDTPNHPITRPEKRRKLKILSMVVICIELAASGILMAFDYHKLAVASIFGIVLALFIASPAGSKFFEMIGGKKCCSANCQQ